MDKAPKKLVLFDFDGVLVDSVDIAFQIHKKEDVNVTPEIHSRMSEGNFFEEAGKMPYIKLLPKEEFMARYTPMLLEKQPIEGMPELIRALHAECGFYVVSSAFENAIRDFLEQHALAGYFKEIMGAETHKLKSEKFRMIFKKENIPPADAVLITDTLGDIREANEVGLASVAFTAGLHSRELLEKGEPWAIADTAPEMLTAIRRYFSLSD